MSLNSMDNDASYQEWSAFCATEVEVRVRVLKLGNLVLPDSEGDSEVAAIFKKMLCEDYWEIEKICQVVVRDADSKSSIIFQRQDDRVEQDRQVRFLDYQKFKCQLALRMLQKISLFDLEHGRDGFLTEQSYARLLRLPAPLVSGLIDKYQESINISDADEEIITKQSAILFAKNSHGVENACEAVTLFCNLGNFAEKFKINRFEIPKLPYREYIMLKMMVSKENHNVAAKNAGGNRNKSRKVSFGGKTMESRGIVIPDTGQKF